MRIVINGKIQDVENEKGLISDLNAIFSDLVSNNRIIVNCLVDELVLDSPNQLVEVIQGQLAEGRLAKEVIIQTQDKDEAVAELLDSIPLFIDQALEFLDNCVGLIQSGGELAINQWDQLISSIDWLGQAIRVIARHCSVDLANQLLFNINEINSVLHQITEALENKDALLVSDLLEYELSDKFILLKQLLNTK